MVDRGGEIPLLSHLIHLSDRIAVQIDPNREIPWHCRLLDNATEAEDRCPVRR